MKWFPILTRFSLKIIFPCRELIPCYTSKDSPCFILSPPIKISTESILKRTLWPILWISKFRMSFFHAHKRVWKTENSQNGSFGIQFHLNWSKLVICDITCISAPPYSAHNLPIFLAHVWALTFTMEAPRPLICRDMNLIIWIFPAFVTFWQSVWLKVGSSHDIVISSKFS